MRLRIDYTEQEWQASTGHHPLKDRPLEDFLWLHRHWMWANHQREALDHLLQQPSEEALIPGPVMMVTKEIGFMFVWYGLLWAIVEASIDPGEGRNLDLRGRFRADIDQVASLLRRCRNAVLHVPRSGELLDHRIQQLVEEPETALVLRRIHRGFARMFLGEFQRRKQPIPDGIAPDAG